MKLGKLILVVTLAIGAAAFGAAQSAGPAGGTLAQSPKAAHVKRPIVVALEQVTGLTTQQKAQIKTLLQQRAADDKAFRKANKGNKTAIREHNKQSTQTLMTNLKGVLSADQFKQFEANLKALRHHGNKKSGTGTASGTTGTTGSGTTSGASGTGTSH